MADAQTTTIPSTASLPDSNNSNNDCLDASSEIMCIETQYPSARSSHTTPQKISDCGSRVSVPASCRAEGQLASNADVGELMVKAKKAAASLWMILHAQSCNDPNCTYPQCNETQTLLGHVQSCTVANSPSSSCPTSCKGCNETRKLLAHYHKCKETRSQKINAQGCLVCSLMARHAKNISSKSMRKQAAMPPPPRQRPRSESYPDLKSPERKSRTVKFASCLRTTRYYHPDKDKSLTTARRPRSLSWGSNVKSDTIEEEDIEPTCTEENRSPRSLQDPDV